MTNKDEALAATSHIAPDAAAIQVDGCKFCLGAKGGVPGNGNVIGGEVICDYCTSLLMKIKDAEREKPTSTIFKASPAIAPEASELPPLQRYDPVAVQFPGYDWNAEMAPNDSGEYVKFEDAFAAIAMHQAAPVKIAGLGRITNEDDGFLTLQFKDEDTAQAFMQNYEPSVDCRDMPDMHRAAADAK